MSTTYYQDFVRDNGLPVTVEYSTTGGEPDFNFPGHICDGGGSGPHVQCYTKLNALEKRPHVRFDWTEQLLIDVRRWADGFIWRKATFEEYRRSLKTSSQARFRSQEGMFA